MIQRQDVYDDDRAVILILLSPMTFKTVKKKNEKDEKHTQTDNKLLKEKDVCNLMQNI